VETLPSKDDSGCWFIHKNIKINPQASPKTLADLSGLTRGGQLLDQPFHKSPNDTGTASRLPNLISQKFGAMAASHPLVERVPPTSSPAGSSSA
jgi:hypothetical protein